VSALNGDLPSPHYPAAPGRAPSHRPRARVYLPRRCVLRSNPSGPRSRPPHGPLPCPADPRRRRPPARWAGIGAAPLAIAVGCGGAPPPGADKPAADAASPAPWSPALPSPADAGSFDAAAVEAAMDAGVRAFATLSADPLLTAYDLAMQGAEGYCPAWYEVDGNVFWYSSCTTSAGTWYDGYGFDYIYEDHAFDDSGTLWDMRAISGAATVRDAAGSTFHLGGGMQVGDAVDAGGWDIRIVQLSGSFRTDDPSLANTWIGQGVTPNTYIYRYDNPAYAGGAAFAYADGDLGGGGLPAVSLHALVGATANVGLPCPDELAGAVSVRDAGGAWWTVTFDVQAQDDGSYALLGDCDGCGTVSDATGAAVGEACLDPSALLDPEAG